MADAILGGGFTVINAHPVKAEMSIATPKSQAKEPIQLDIIVVCRKQSNCAWQRVQAIQPAIESARSKLDRLGNQGFEMSRNDEKIVLYGQLLASISDGSQLPTIAEIVEAELKKMSGQKPLPLRKSPQRMLFDEP